jgi:hypothetical protein
VTSLPQQNESMTVREDTRRNSSGTTTYPLSAMSVSLKSINTADLKSIGTGDPGSPHVVNPQPDSEDMKKVR